MARKSSKQKTSSSSTTEASASAPTPEPVPEVQNEVIPQEKTAPVVGEVIGQMFTETLSTLDRLRAEVSALTKHVRRLKAQSDREIKLAQKTSRRRKNANRKPSGFTKPTPISEELATFLGKDKETLMARTEVTKEINRYIRENNLKDPKNGRNINADSKLRKLLKLSKSDKLTFFNLQTFLSGHFKKATPATTTETA